MGYTYRRNPSYKQAKGDIPYIDAIEWPIIPEYASALAQFIAGNVFSFAIRLDDVLAAKAQVPALELREGEYIGNPVWVRTGFGILPSSPFKDERVRQAWMLTYDRQTLLDVVGGISRFAAQGIEVKTTVEGLMPGNAWKGWYLDPRSKEFGPNSRYFKQDLAEAKKLLAAAGFANGVEHPFTAYFPGPGSPANQPSLDILTGFARDSGLFRFQINQINFNTEWLPNYQNGRGLFDGVAIVTAGRNLDPAIWAYSYYSTKGTRAQGTDAFLDELSSKALTEFDTKKRLEIVHETQRYEGKANFFPRTGGIYAPTLTWPVLRNLNVHRGGSSPGRQLATLFLDPERQPLKKSS